MRPASARNDQGACPDKVARPTPISGAGAAKGKKTANHKAFGGRRPLFASRSQAVANPSGKATAAAARAVAKVKTISGAATTKVSGKRVQAPGEATRTRAGIRAWTAKRAIPGPAAKRLKRGDRGNGAMRRPLRPAMRPAPCSERNPNSTARTAKGAMGRASSMARPAERVAANSANTSMA